MIRIGIGIGMSSAQALLCSASLQVLRGPFVGSVAARGRRLAAVAVGELCSARSLGIVGRKKHGFRGGFGGRG
jgi:hypothetical protein